MSNVCCTKLAFEVITGKIDALEAKSIDETRPDGTLEVICDRSLYQGLALNLWACWDRNGNYKEEDILVTCPNCIKIMKEAGL